MFLGKVIGDAEDSSNESTSEGSNTRLKVVQKLDLYRNPSGESSIAVDFVGADDGDIVIVAPPNAETSPGPLNLSGLPADGMIMGVLEGQKPNRIRRPSLG